MKRKRVLRGFSFTEILFAVMILGIGFIMVAAMFPVAIRQTEDGNRETIAASLGRAGDNLLNPVATSLVAWPYAPNPVWSSVLLPTFMSPVYPRAAIMIPAGQTSVVKPGQVWSFNDFRDTYSPIGLGVPGQPVGTIAASHAQYLWGLIAKNMIQTTDQRFAWVAMYKRDLIAQGPSGSMQVPVPAPYAQIFLVGVESRAKPAYDPVNDVQISASPLQPQYLSGVKMTPPTVAGGISTVTFNAGQPSYAAVGENTYLIISSDYNQGLYNGRIYRIGVYRPDISPTTWALIPGEDMTVTDPALNVDVFVVGRGADPNNPGQVAGSAQDVSVYTTYVPTN